MSGDEAMIMPTDYTTWPKRPRVEIRHDHRRRIWTSLDGRFRIVHSRCLLSGGYAPRFYAMEYEWMADGHCVWSTLSTHRKFARAKAACETRARQLKRRKAG